MPQQEPKTPPDEEQQTQQQSEDAIDNTLKNTAIQDIALEAELHVVEEALSEEEQLQADLKTAKEQVLRSAAELENFRKRVYREMDESRRYANIDLMRDLLPLGDNIERAIEAAEKSEESGALLDGVKIVLQQFESVLEKYHCKKIDALGQPFDPNRHEAILQQPSDQPDNTIILQTQTGFQLHDRIVRPSQVIVGKNSGENNIKKE